MGENINKSRAWAEINLDALAHNLADIRKNIKSDCEVIAVVKANAYGHGMTRVSKRLTKEGINFFAVGCLSEAIELRAELPEADILILGYTKPSLSKIIHDNNIIQCITSAAYAKQLNDVGFEIRSHIGIDTGMRRYGIDALNLDDIENVYSCKNLKIEGIATHFASADSLDANDISYTRLQVKRFSDVITKLKSNGYDTGKVHCKSSYAIYNFPDFPNFPEFRENYVRPGIMLYGVQSQADKTKTKTNLRPLLELKALVTGVRWINPGDSVSYGRLFTAEAPTKIATISIGYADGYPRSISGSGAMCVINGHKVPIVGRVCMDSIMADATSIEDIKEGDVATLIGRDGEQVISAEEIALAAGTITNDLLCGLGERVERVYFFEL